jgi:predicted transcriptional regulator
MKKMNFYLPDPVIARLQELAEKTGLSVAELVRRAIDEYLKKQK